MWVLWLQISSDYADQNYSGQNNPDQHNNGSNPHHSKKTLYKIKDPFLRFWFTVVAPNRSILSQAPSSVRKKILIEALPRLFSLMWEELVRMSVPLLPYKGIHFGPSERFWKGQDSEWDLVAESLDRNTLLLGEAKWNAKKPGVSWVYQEIDNLKKKGVPPISRKASVSIVYALFIPEKPKNLKPLQGVRVWDAEDVITALRKE